MILVWKDLRPDVIEDGTCFIKIDAVLSQVTVGFARVLFKASGMQPCCSYASTWKNCAMLRNF